MRELDLGFGTLGRFTEVEVTYEYQVWTGVGWRTVATGLTVRDVAYQRGRRVASTTAVEGMDFRFVAEV